MQTVSARLPDAAADRLDALIAYVASDPGIRASGVKVTRSTVARVALELGISALEARRAAGASPVPATDTDAAP